MSKDRRQRDDFESVDETRRWLAPKTSSRSAADRRDGERRRADRRGQANTARRAEDAERNQHRRALLLSFLGTLSHDDLLLWIDRLWLGHASEPQLDTLVASVRESPHFAERIASRRASGGPRTADSLTAAHAPNSAWLSAEWRNLSEQLTVFASLRRHHHSAGHQKRNGKPKSSQYRDACLASPIGARVNAAELFDDFFNGPERTPAEMAAQLLQREVQSQLRALEPSARRGRRLGSFTAAAAAFTALALFPKWRTLSGGSRNRPRTPPDPRS